MRDPFNNNVCMSAIFSSQASVGTGRELVLTRMRMVAHARLPGLDHFLISSERRVDLGEDDGKTTSSRSCL